MQKKKKNMQKNVMMALGSFNIQYSKYKPPKYYKII